MSETQSRPSGTRGRGSHRGGRGGFRGGRGTGKGTKTEAENSPPPTEGNRELLELKKKHGSKVTTVKEMFPNWTDEDIVYALEDAGGDLEGTVERITSGSTGQWGEVSKKTDRARSKAKDTQPGSHEVSGTRSSRGRGGTEGRARGRGTDRGRGSRGGRGTSQTNGTRTTEKPAKTAQDSSEAPVEEGWGDSVPDAAEGTGSWADAATNGDSAADAGGKSDFGKESKTKIDEPKSTIVPSTKVSNWAGLFAKPPPEPAPKRAPTPPPIAAVETPPLVDDSFANVPILEPPVEAVNDGPPNDSLKAMPSEPAINITPSKDELTHDNLEHIPDVSQPITSATAVSTVASTQDPNSNMNSAQPSIRPGMSGFAASALKATAASGRTSSFQRRVLEQQEAVVMPENHAVSRAAMQFGSMNIGQEDGGPDDDREDPETRTQLPDDSPVAPRASLPKAAPPSTQAAAEPPTAPKAAPGLPPAPQQQASASPPQNTSYADQFTRYGQAPPKAYDAFGQQTSQQQPPPQQSGPPAQESLTSQAPSQGQTTSATAPGDYAAYYGQDSQRAYQNFYGYGQNQEVQQRSGSAFGTMAESQSQYATSRPQAGIVSQEAPNSGHNTPNPTPSAQQPQQQQQAQSMHQGQASHGGYPYGYANAAYNQPYPQYASYMNQMNQQHQYGQGRPMFDDARRYDETYMSHNNQYGSYGGRQQYAAGHYNKSAMYGQPQHQYSSYDHSSSPANAGPLSQTSAGREASYGRTGSAQPSESQQASTASAFGGMTDPFSREQSNFGSHTPMSQQHGAQMGLEDHSKSYDATKGVPSPQMKNAHRPASAANMQAHPQASSQQPSSFPPPQSTNQQHAAFGNYPQYTGFGANVGGAHQSQHQQQQQQQQQGLGAAGQGSHPGQNAQQQQQQQQYGYGSAAGGFGSYGAAGYGAGAGRGWASSYGAGH